MKKSILIYCKNIVTTILVLFLVALAVGLYLGATVHYGDDPLRKDLHGEGPYIFYQGDSLLQVNYLGGNKDDGFYLEQTTYPVDTVFNVSCLFRLDSTNFNFTIDTNTQIPPSNYTDQNKILAISDIESGYRTFRDFLIHNQVIDQQLNWSFGKGHLVLLGDFVDRGNSTTQVLWFIYKLEQQAQLHGGQVHYIIGNHELKSMQAKFGAASQKYLAVAAILGKQQAELYHKTSFLGKWLETKNSVERINGHLFVHGGIHPELADINLHLDTLNEIARANYRTAYYPDGTSSVTQLINSTRKGLAWYRGYFKEHLPQADIDKILTTFQAKTIVVGHTLQTKVNRQYDGKVIGIDVKHPRDYNKNWPNKHSEGLLIEGEEYFRVFDTGKQEKI